MSGQSTTTGATVSPLVQATILNLLEQALAHGATAIHIEPRQRLTVIRFRTDGLMHNITKLPREHHQAMVTYVKGLATSTEPDTGVGSFLQATDKGNVLVQIVITPVVDGDRVVLHLTPQTDAAASLANLGFWGSGRAAVEHALCQPHGLILTGSIDQPAVGQTSQALVGVLQEVQRQVIDIDPQPTPTIDGINQLPFNKDQFAERLNWALQQNEDVIVIGHLTDKTSISLALETALNQKLLLGTVSAISVARALRRLLEAGAESHLLAASLRLTAITKPVRQLCPHCREVYKPTKTTWQRLAKAMDMTEAELYQLLHKLERHAQPELGQDIDDLSSSDKGIARLWKHSPVGCQTCHFTGYRGRLLLTEVLEPTPAVQRAIVLGQSAKQIQTAIRQSGTISLEIDGLVKALRGLTTLEEIVGKRYR